MNQSLRPSKSRLVVHSDACMHAFVRPFSNKFNETPALWIDFLTGIPSLMAADCFEISALAGASTGIPILSSRITGLPIQGSRIHPRSRDLYRHSRSVCTAPAQLQFIATEQGDAKWCQVMQRFGISWNIEEDPCRGHQGITADLFTVLSLDRTRLRPDPSAWDRNTCLWNAVDHVYQDSFCPPQSKHRPLKSWRNSRSVPAVMWTCFHPVWSFRGILLLYQP